jgi:ribosomal protein L24
MPESNVWDPTRPGGDLNVWRGATSTATGPGSPPVSGAGVSVVPSTIVEMQAAIDAAGDGAKLIFPRSAIIELRGALMPLAGQQWDLNGCTLKRNATQAITTTTTIISTGGAGPRVLAVASAADFRVGDGVYLYQGSTFETYPHSLIAVDYNANTITVEGVFAQAFSGTTTIAQGGPLIRHKEHGIDYPGVTIANGKLQDAFTTAAGAVNWATHSSVLLCSSRGILERIEVDSPTCEGLVISVSYTHLRAHET